MACRLPTRSQATERVRVEIDAPAASIATVFPMEADEVAAYPNSMMMIHNAWTIAVGNAGSLRMQAEVLDQLDGTIASIYARKTGGDVAQFRELMARETFMDMPKAMELGLVDSLIEGKKAKPANRQAIADFPAVGMNRGCSPSSKRPAPGLPE